MEAILKEHERRLTKLEEQHEHDSKDLVTVINELKHITSSVENISANLKDSIDRFISHQEEENVEIHDEINALRKDLDARTYEKNSNNFDKIKMEIFLTILGIIIGAIATYLMK